MSVGYPDFARLSRDGTTQLYEATGNVPNFSVLFEGFVGNWPYLSVSTWCNSPSDNCQLVMLYKTDHTFTNSVAARYAVRQSDSICYTMYPNLSDWLELYINTASGNAFDFAGLSILATTGKSNSLETGTLDVPILYNDSHINASTLQTFTTQKIFPGNAQFSFLTGAASWYVQPQYWDYGSQSWVTICQISSAQYPNKQFVIDMPMIDAPMRVQVNNGDSVSQNFIFSWVPK